MEWRRAAAAEGSVGADRHFDVVAVGILEEGRVGARGPAPGFPRRADTRSSRPRAPLVGGLDGGDAAGAEADQAEARRRSVIGGDEEDGLRDPPADDVVLVEVAAPAERAEEAVVEVGA